ncbi:phage baseplate assembly protein V [Rapidithrix thailandica]|uniref:Phage baseplate assembly protein V n=1 Tax=Rapidithrix thailandica TaxID=413964 RepID=A0AAW9S4Z2_9BACT
MAKPVDIKLFIGGNEGEEILQNSNFSIKLEQKIAAHHKLTIECPMEALEDTSGQFAEKAQGYIGQTLSLSINTDELVFNGIVMNVKINKEDGGNGSMEITAYSPTKLMDNGKDSQSYEQKTLKEIIDAAVKGHQYEFNVESKPRYQNKIPYTVQYKESDFDFIRRLAVRYGEWLYYDGQSLQFGNSGLKVTPLRFGESLESFNVSMITKPQRHTYLAYDFHQAGTHKAEMKGPEKQEGNSSLNMKVAYASKNLYAKVPTAIYNNSLMENGPSELSNVSELKSKHALNTVEIDGESDEVQIALGNIVDITGKNMAVVGKTDPYGKYIITRVTHVVKNSREYSNKFEGVPHTIEVPNYFDENAVPSCEEQYAIVVDNHDPKGMSRIRVRFPWQIDGQLSPWLRVATPYAGKGKGFHVLPEINEEVLVGFENGNAEKPFVIGAMFHGQGKSGFGGKGNHKKGFVTASGNRLEIDDEWGSVTLADSARSRLILDGSNNAAIQSEDLIALVLETENSTWTSAATKLLMKGTGEVLLEGEKVLTLQVGESSIVLQKDGTIILSGNDIIINSNKTINTSSSEETNINGKAVNIN